MNSYSPLMNLYLPFLNLYPRLMNLYQPLMNLYSHLMNLYLRNSWRNFLRRFYEAFSVFAKLLSPYRASQSSRALRSLTWLRKLTQEVALSGLITNYINATSCVDFLFHKHLYKDLSAYCVTIFFLEKKNWWGGRGGVKSIVIVLVWSLINRERLKVFFW